MIKNCVVTCSTLCTTLEAFVTIDEAVVDLLLISFDLALSLAPIGILNWSNLMRTKLNLIRALNILRLCKYYVHHYYLEVNIWIDFHRVNDPLLVKTENYWSMEWLLVDLTFLADFRLHKRHQ